MDEIDQLIEQLHNQLNHHINSNRPAIDLVEMGDPAFDRLIQLLNHPDSTRVASAAMLLGHFKDKRAIQPLIQALKIDNEWAVSCVATALGILQANEALDALIELVNRNGNSRAIDALGMIGDRRAVEPIIASMKHDSLPREHVHALVTLGDVKAIPALIKALKKRGDDDRIRGTVVDGLVNMGEPGMTALSKALIKGKSDFRHNVMWELESVGQVWGLEILNPFADAFVACLSDADQDIQYTAAHFLADIGDQRAIEPLRKFLASDDEYKRESAAKALQKLAYKLDVQNDD